MRHESQGGALAHSLGAVVHVELAHHLLQVVLHRGRADAQDLADLHVGLAVFHPVQHLDLALGQQGHGCQVHHAAGGFAHAHAVQRQVHVGHEQLQQISVALAGHVVHAGEHKKAAVVALANLAKASVPEQVNIAYGETKLTFGRDYIIPKPFDPRLIASVPPAVAKAAMDSGVAKEPITDWDKYKDELLERMGSDNKMVRLLTNRARTNPKRIIFAEADQLDVLKAAQIVHEEGIGFPILLGNKEIILELKEEIGFDIEVPIFDPKTKESEAKRLEYANHFWQTRKRKGVTLYEAEKWMRERNYFGLMMVNKGEADAMVTGHSRSYPSTIKPVMQLIDKAPGVSKIATTNMMMTSRGPIFLSDTAINPNPSADDLARIALMTAKTVRMFGMEPVIAMVSYSNFGSSHNEGATKISQAVAYLHENFPDLIVDGEIQTDFALNSELLKSKFPFSKLVNKKVNTLIFPNLDSANITYKLLKELNKAESIGPIILGLDKPVHVFQLGASVEEMVNMAAVAVVDAQEKSRKQNKL